MALGLQKRPLTGSARAGRGNYPAVLLGLVVAFLVAPRAWCDMVINRKLENNDETE